jgi:hypothetical protein
MTPFFPRRRAVSRRQFLRGAGVAVALPWVDAMRPAFAAAPEPAPPRRVLAICNNLGLIADKFFPTAAGPNYELTPYLELIKDHRDRFTVFSGVSHPDVDGAHAAELCFLTAAPHPANSGFRNTISLDQYVAERVGHLTRFPSLQLAVNADPTRRCLSWTGSGAMIPSEDKASVVFRRLFLQGSAADVDARVRQLAMGRSVLDAVADQTRGLQAGLGPKDRDRIDQYLTGVRDLEKRLAAAGEWERRPRPKVTAAVPTDPPSPALYMDKVRVMYDLAKLAFETDSTRLVTLMLDGASSPVIEVEGADITVGYHDLSHHGQSPEKLAQLEQIDREHMRKLNGLFDGLAASREAGGSLFDRTMVVYGSNFGNASSHVNTNLPVVFAGGGFRHGRHLAFDRGHNYPLANLFVSMLQRLGVEADRFASSTGTMRGLEMA